MLLDLYYRRHIDMYESSITKALAEEVTETWAIDNGGFVRQAIDGDRSRVVFEFNSLEDFKEENPELFI